MRWLEYYACGWIEKLNFFKVVVYIDSKSDKDQKNFFFYQDTLSHVRKVLINNVISQFWSTKLPMTNSLGVRYDPSEFFFVCFYLQWQDFKCFLYWSREKGFWIQTISGFYLWKIGSASGLSKILDPAKKPGSGSRNLNSMLYFWIHQSYYSIFGIHAYISVCG